MISQDLTFLEIASEISKTGFQFIKEDTTQRNGVRTCPMQGKRMLEPTKRMTADIWEGPVVKRDWEVTSPISGEEGTGGWGMGYHNNIQ